MRVSKGKVKGHPLQKPPILNLRPVLEPFRDEIFKELEGLIKNASVLDLFAGSGSLGIEALSLGAKEVTFVDNHPRAYETILKNINISHFFGKTKVIKKDALRFALETPQTFDLIFIDPPTNYDSLTPLLVAISKRMNKNALIILRLPFTLPIPQFSILTVFRQKRLTDTFVFFLKKAGI